MKDEYKRGRKEKKEKIELSKNCGMKELVSVKKWVVKTKLLDCEKTEKIKKTNYKRKRKENAVEKIWLKRRKKGRKRTQQLKIEWC